MSQIHTSTQTHTSGTERALDMPGIKPFPSIVILSSLSLSPLLLLSLSVCLSLALSGSISACACANLSWQCVSQHQPTTTSLLLWRALIMSHTHTHAEKCMNTCSQQHVLHNALQCMVGIKKDVCMKMKTILNVLSSIPKHCNLHLDSATDPRRSSLTDVPSRAKTQSFIKGTSEPRQHLLVTELCPCSLSTCGQVQVMKHIAWHYGDHPTHHS